MGYRVKGTLKLPDGSPASNAEIEFISRKNFSPLVQELKSNILCGLDGAYDVTLEHGEYAVMVYPGGTYPEALGTIVLAADTAAGQDLPTLLQQSGWQPATPEYIQQIATWLAEANASATSSAASASAAKVSETNSKASENAALSSKNSAASSASTATTKAAEAASSASAALASKNASATSEANSLSSKDAAEASASTAVAAADTATQKAVSAATHDASAQDAATRAENAVSAVVGAVLDGGECDLSLGVYPQPITVSGKKYSTIWYVAVAGSVSGVTFDVGDILRYTTAKTGYYFKVDAKDDVYSVNGEKGVVTVSPEKIGAEKTGVAQLLVNQHAAKPAVHPISGVSGLQPALDAKPSRNILINGEVTRINQRGFNGDWTSLAVGAYGYDRWKKADSTNMAQVVEAGNFIPGAKYRLSGTGVVEATLTAPVSGDWTISVPQAARNIQLELGEVSTPFEVRNIQIELAMCQRYFFRNYSEVQYAATCYGGWGAATAIAGFQIDMPVLMRRAPDFRLDGGYMRAVGGGSAGNISGFSYSIFSGNTFYIEATLPTATLIGGQSSRVVFADGGVRLDAEL